MIILHFCSSVRAQESARSSKISKKSNSSDISPLNEGALFEPGPGIAVIPLFVADMAGTVTVELGFRGMEAVVWTGGK